MTPVSAKKQEVDKEKDLSTITLPVEKMRIEKQIGPLWWRLEKEWTYEPGGTLVTLEWISRIGKEELPEEVEGRFVFFHDGAYKEAQTVRLSRENKWTVTEKVLGKVGVVGYVVARIDAIKEQKKEKEKGEGESDKNIISLPKDEIRTEKKIGPLWWQLEKAPTYEPGGTLVTLTLSSQLLPEEVKGRFTFLHGGTHKTSETVTLNALNKWSITEKLVGNVETVGYKVEVDSVKEKEDQSKATLEWDPETAISGLIFLSFLP